jgi:hypothetical protein
VTLPPTYWAPLPNVTVLSNRRLWVLAPTAVTHGASAGEPTVAAPWPALPAEVATNTPARAANRNETASASEASADGASEPIE